jgi:crossover junction endodeoxyribonuclease RuvC
MKPMVVLGVDPGLKRMGFGILKKEGNKVESLDYGTFLFNAHMAIPKKLTHIYEALLACITSYKVTHIAVETPFLGDNPQSFLKLGYVRAIVYLISVQAALHLQEFSPREVKIKVVRNGNASKEEVAKSLILLLNDKELGDASLDATDALAVAWCGIWKEEYESKSMS